MSALVIALGFAVLFQFIILRIKWNKGQYADVGVDALMLLILNGIFGGSILGVISATAGSTLISLYLIWYPIKVLDNLSQHLPDSSESNTDSSNEFSDLFSKMKNTFTKEP